MVLNVGQGGACVQLERYAHNCNQSRYDNAGELPPAPAVLEGGPRRYTTLFDLEALLAMLRDAGIAAHISNDAGGYLCNFVSYYCYHTLAYCVPPVPALFVHVPPFDGTDDGARLAVHVQMLELVARAGWQQMSDM
jgi:pyroglutamyl-peptidase